MLLLKKETTKAPVAQILQQLLIWNTAPVMIFGEDICRLTSVDAHHILGLLEHETFGPCIDGVVAERSGRLANVTIRS
jgi:hypothetical protein